MRIAILFLFLLVFICSCTQSAAWQHEDIDSKLKKIFPRATVICVFNSKESMENETDSFHMPAPTFKAVVSEHQASSYDFIFYFYNDSFADTTLFSKIFKAVMIYDMRMGLGNTKSPYALTLPKFDKTGNKSLVAGVSLMQHDSGCLVEKEKNIEKIFDLQNIRMKNATIKEVDSL